MSDEYWKLLQDPRWKAKRLEIIERASSACEECGATECAFHVHHTYYERGLMPWEYPNDSLLCLCKLCHDARHEAQMRLKRVLGSLTTSELLRLVGQIEAMKERHDERIAARRRDTDDEPVYPDEIMDYLANAGRF